MPISSILSSLAFTTCLFFYLYIFGSFFSITIYPLTDRVTSHIPFQKHVMNEYSDKIIAIAAATLWFLFSLNNNAMRYSFSIGYGSIGAILAIISPDNLIFDVIALLSLPLIIVVTLYCYYYCYYKRQRNILNFNAKLALRYVSLSMIAISVMWIGTSTLSSFIAPDFESIARGSYANQLFLLLSSFSTIYIVLLVFCLPVKVLLRSIFRMLKLDIKEYPLQVDSNNSKDNNSGTSSRLKTQTKIGFIVLAMIVSVVLVLIPQHPSINKDNQEVGVDTSYYGTWIGELAKSKSLSDFVYQAFVIQGQDGDRPLSLIFLFLVYQIAGGDLYEVIDHSPIVLGPGIILASYFLTLELTRNEKIAVIAAFLAAVTFHTLVGIYAGFYANWLALIVGYTSIVFLFRYLRSNRPFDIVVFSTLLILVLFFHVYTWTVLAAVTGIFLVAMLLMCIRKKNNNNHFTKRRIIWLLVAITLSIAVDINKTLLTGSSVGLEQDIELAQTNLGMEQFIERWQILNITMHAGMGGVFSNFIILILGLVWVLKSNMRDPGTVFLMIFLSSALVPLFFGNWVIQARLFYDMPFQIPAAIALYYLSKRSGSILVTLAACTWLLAVSLFAVMNYHLISVPGML
jgi:hypothetical protein